MPALRTPEARDRAIGSASERPASHDDTLTSACGPWFHMRLGARAMSVRGRRLKRAAHILVGVLVLLAVVLGGRLAYGPIALDFLRPSLERALGPADGSFSIHLGSTELAWDRAAREPRLRVRDVRILGRNGVVVATVPALALHLATGALLRGVVAPAEIELLQPRLEIARRSDGTLDLGITDGQRESDRHLDLRRIVDGLAGEAPAGTVSPLRAFSARGAEIAITDQSSGRAWRLVDADVVLEPDATGLVGSLAGRLLVADSTISVRAITRYRPGRDRGSVAVRFRGLDPGILAGPVGLNMPLDGTIIVVVDSALRAIGVRGHARGGAGRLALPEIAPEPIELSGLRCRARLDPRARHLQLQRLTLALGASRIHIVGGVAWDEHGSATVDTQAHAERMPLETLGRWWPPQLAAPARRWVAEHLRDGIIRTADLALRGTIGGRAGEVAVQPSGGRVAFDGIAVRYDDRFPLMTDVAGTAQLDHAGWTVRATRGRVGAIELIGGSAAIPADADQRSRAQLTVALRGPIAESAALLDREPFGYARALGIVPAEVTGTMTAQLEIGAPLRASRPGPQTTVTGAARLTDLGVPRILGGRALSDGEIVLDIEAGSLRATGTARLAGAPVSLIWTEDTATAAGVTRRVTVTARLDSANRAALGFDLSPWLEGPMDAEAKLVAASDGSGVLDLHARLDDAVIDPGVARLAKAAGIRGSADARVILQQNVVARVERLTLEAGPSTVTGTATRDVDGAGWASARIRATVATDSRGTKSGRCELSVQREQNVHRFALTSEDTGALLEAIAGDDRVRGGRLVLEGTAEPSDGTHVLAGSLDVRSLVVARSPVLARIATLASLSGIRDALGGAGVSFERIGATLRYREPTLSISDGLANGPALAIAVDGTIDRRAATADLRGTVVPEYYGLNTAPARIPVLGDVVAGGEGVQAIDFTVTGALADPRVSVEPVSAITPAALRELLRKLRR